MKPCVVLKRFYRKGFDVALFVAWSRLLRSFGDNYISPLTTPHSSLFHNFDQMISAFSLSFDFFI